MARATGTEQTYILAGGGSGGHLYPGLAVAEAIRQVEPSAAVLFLTTDRAIDQRILADTGWGHLCQAVVPIPRRVVDVVDFWRRWRASVRLCEQVLRENRVAAVLGLGGFASGPMVKAAVKVGVPVAILNHDAVPGRANRYAQKRVDRVFLQWERSRKYFARYGGKAVVTGCPIRSGFGGLERTEAADLLGLDDQRRTLVVMGGSQGGHNVNTAVVECLSQSGWTKAAAQDWQVVHLTGQSDRQWVEQQYEKVVVQAEVLAYSERMDAVLAVAELVIGRAGASSLAELCATGTPSILLPYPYHRDQHQLRNAEVLAECGAAEIVRDQRNAEKTARALAEVLRTCFGDEDRLASMGESARRVGRPDAAMTVAKELIKLAVG